MHLKKLKLINFRNYKQQQVIFCPYFNFLVGNNAQGKTNLMEAIYYLSVGKSHRTLIDKELINWGNSFFYVKGNINKEDRSKDIEIGYDKKNKKAKVNGIVLKKRGELLGNLNCIFFSPEELKLVKEGPGYRRKFLDDEILQMKPAYYHFLNNYNRILFQRNSLLKEAGYRNNIKDSLNIWDKQMAWYGAKILLYRDRFIKRISMLSREVHSKITGGDEELDIRYYCCIQLEKDFGVSDIQKALISGLKEVRDKDIRLGTSSFGPHREDFIISINGIDARKYGSQGQQRTATLSIKISEIELVKEETGEYPVLLLDDVMSELDPLRQRYIIENLSDIQVFVTCTSLSGLMKEDHNEYKIFKVEKGLITDMNI